MSRNSIFCKSALAIAAIAVVFAFSSCNKDGKNVKRFQDAAMNLDNTTQTLEYEYDYWPNGGIRATGDHLASLISLSDLEKMLPCPLYLSGPHKNGEWDLYSEDFGHYNPEAIQYLADLAAKVVSDEKFVKLSAPLVDKYLNTQMWTMLALHDVLYSEDIYSEEGRDYVFNDIMENYGYSDEAFYIINSMDLEDVSSVYSNFGFEMLYFWARRYTDGTIDQFYQGLSTVYKAYYPDYEFNPTEYWFEGDGDYYFEETMYNCELEEDEPIADNERIKEKDAIEMIKTATGKLDKSTLVLEDEFDYWPDCGLRVTAGHLFSLISLRTLNRMLPCDLYVSGPHYYNRWNFNDPWDFGHYNPEAIAYLNNLATKIVADKKFVDRTRPLVEKNLKRQMFILRELYNALNNKELCPDKESVLEDCMNSQGYDWNELLSQLDLEDGSYVYGNTGNMFLYWWARRNADGTMELFHEGLETVYNAYFPEE